MKKFIAVLVLAFVSISFPAFAAPTPPPSKKALDFVNRLMKRMTLEEKAAQLVQVTAGGAVSGPGEKPEFQKMIARGEVGTVLNSYSLESMITLQRTAVEKTRLKIPLLFAGDIVNGMYTKFPTPLAESSSWNIPLIEKSARLAAIEASAIGLDWTYAPMVDIARDPRWGRVVEGAGEDPWWGAYVSAARVRGFQGRKLTDQGTMMACAKHFAGYGAALAGRDYNTVELSEREMREVYLPPFRAAVDAGVSTLMAAFNDISGVPSSANSWLMKSVLRKEWGFRGFLVSDYSSIKELMNHGVAVDLEAAAKLSFKAGLDVDMEGYAYHKHLASLVRRGQVSEAALNASVRNVLLAKYNRGLFHNPYRFMNEKRALEVAMSPEHLAHTREIARRSIVLLKNDGSLPLQRSGKIALIGPMAELEFGLTFDGSFQGVKRKPESFLSAMQAQATRGEFELLRARGARLTVHGRIQDERSDEELMNEAVEVAQKADVIVLSIGESPDQVGEAASKTQIRVHENQWNLMRRMRALGKPIVTVLSNGRPLVLKEIVDDSNALLETWFLGTLGGEAIVDVLFGDHNPSGKLTVSFPRNEGQIPIFYAVRNTGRPISDDMWTSKYLDSPNSPQFPFGWGLSYTKFAYSDLRLQPRNGVLEVSVTVTNTGERAGTETAQLYIRDLVASVSRPVQQLRGFQQLSLSPGESRRITMKLKEEDLRFYNPEMKWVSEPGRFHVMVGGNSVEVLKAEFGLAKNKAGRWVVLR